MKKHVYPVIPPTRRPSSYIFIGPRDELLGGDVFDPDRAGLGDGLARQQAHLDRHQCLHRTAELLVVHLAAETGTNQTGPGRAEMAPGGADGERGYSAFTFITLERTDLSL